MNTNTWNLFGGLFTAAPIILLLLKHFATEYISNFTKELFNTKTKKKTDSALNGVIYFLFAIAAIMFLTPKVAPSLVTHNHKTLVNKIEPRKTDAQVIAETATTVYQETSSAIKAKQEKNKIAKEQREKRFVYQIGTVKNDDEVMCTLYKKMLTVPRINTSRISAFKLSRKKYFLFYNEEQTQEELESSLVEFKSKISFIEPYVQIVDIMSECSLKEDIIEISPLKFRKEKTVIRCFECSR